MRASPFLLVLAGCGASSAPAPPVDAALQREAHAGQSAYKLERPAEAIAAYRAALIRAQASDDLPAITDFSFNIAVAQLRANDPRACFTTTGELRAELARRGASSFPALDLLEATSLYRIGRVAEADRLAASAQNGQDAEAAAQAAFLRGLIADDAGDLSAMRAMLQALGTAPPSAEGQADAAELRARILLRQGDAAGARAEAERAASARQDLLDYRRLARALSVAARAAQQSGDQAAAADLFLRAGRSAAAQGDTAEARAWLRDAMRGGTDPALRRAAREALARLGAV